MRRFVVAAAAIAACFDKPPRPGGGGGGDGGGTADVPTSSARCQNRMHIDPLDGTSTPCTTGVSIGGGMATMTTSSGQQTCTFSFTSMDNGILVEVASLSPGGTSGTSAIAKLALALNGNSIMTFLSMTQFSGSPDDPTFTTDHGGAQALPRAHPVWLLFEVDSSSMVTAKVTEDSDPGSARWIDVLSEGLGTGATTGAGTATIELQIGGTGSGSVSAVFENLDYCL